MKKIKIFSIFILIFICCTGCGASNSEVTRDLRHAGFNLSDEDFSCDALIPKSGKEYEVIKYLGSNYAITTTGVIYELSFGQMFSNNEYCRKAETELNVVSVFESSVFRANDDKIYYLVGNSSAAAYTEVPTSDNNYNLYKFFLGDSSVVKVCSHDGAYYVLKTDGIVYKYLISKNGNNYSLISSEKVYSSESYGSNIVDFNYAGDSSKNTYIKTENSYYRVTAVNSEECSKYVDITCEYQFGKDEILTNHYEHIMAFDGSRIITDYLKIFNLS